MNDKNELHYFELEYRDGNLTGKRQIDSLYRFHGYAEEYFPSGKLRNHGYFFHGKWDSVWVHFNENGDTTCIQYLKRGKLLSQNEKVNGAWINRSYSQLSKDERAVFDKHLKGKGEFAKAPKIPMRSEKSLEDIFSGQ